MKFFLQILIFFLLVTQIHYSQWTNQNLVPNRDTLWSTFFIDDNTGWIVGTNGFIKKTTNAGNEWIDQNSGTTSILKSIQFVDQNTGWICGESGLILKTTNGGQNWFSLTSGTTQHLTDIQFCDLNVGYAVGFGGTILKTTDGGSSWTNLSTGTANDLYSMDFVNSLIGYAVGGSGSNWVILKTTDGGTSWINKSSGITNINGYCLSVEFIDANTGFIGGDNQAWPTWYKTTDGGDTWFQSSLSDYPKSKKQNHTEQLSPYPVGRLNCIFFRDANNGWIVANPYGLDSYIYETTDAGITWARKYQANWQRPFLSVFVTQNGKGWAVGVQGLIGMREDSNSDWSLLLSGPSTIYSIDFVNEYIGWAAAYRLKLNQPHEGVVFKTTNGGKIWKTQLAAGLYGPMRYVYFINELIGWVVASQGTPQKLIGGGIFRTTDGGENWSMVSTIDCSYIFFINQNIGWVTSNYSSFTGIHKSTDGGITWVQKSSISSSSVYFLDINNGWATSANGILKSTDGGETWINKSSSSGSYIRFYNSNIGMCVGGGILVSTDGGETWSAKSGPSLQSINFINSTTIWGYSSEGTVYKTFDFGDNWISLNVGLGSGRTSFFINEYTGWVGDGNNIFKYSVEPIPLVTLTSPNGGEIWKSGWQRNITWSSENISNINLYYSTNSGSNWNTIATNVDASVGSYNWTIPILTWFINLNCKVKIEDASNSSVYDESDDTFIIWHFCNIIQYANLGQRIIDFLETNIDISLNVTTSDNISVTYYPYETPTGGTLPSGVVVLSDYYWQVTSTNLIFSNGKIIVPISTLRGVTDATKLVWLKRTNSGDDWENIGGIVSGENLESTVIFNSFSEFAIGSTDPVNPLPVELYSFEASVSGSSVNLKWKTKTEVNNYGFEVERCLENSWGKIGFVQGYGNSNSPKSYSFSDNNPFGGSKFQYRLKQLDTDGQFEYSDIVEVEILPDKFALFQNYPNPFNPATKIRYQLPEESKVIIKIYDILGTEVATLVNEKREPGTYEVELNSNSLSSGTYIYRIVAGEFVETKKMVLLR